MSIRFRLNALIVALSRHSALLVLVAAMVVSAGPRIRAENDSIMRLAKEFVETTIESLQGTPDPGARLEVLLDGLKELRHVHIYRIDDPSARTRHARGACRPAMRPPGWRVSARPSPGVEVPIVVNGQDFGTLVIAPRVVRRGGRDLGLRSSASRIGGGGLADRRRAS